MRHAMILGMLVAMGLAGCGSTSTSSPATSAPVPGAPDLSRFDTSTFANEELCEHAVAAFENAEFESSTVPTWNKGLFNRTSYDQHHRDRVRKCTITMSERQAACFALAPSMQYLRNCAKFAEIR